MQKVHTMYFTLSVMLPVRPYSVVRKGKIYKGDRRSNRAQCYYESLKIINAML